MKYKLPEWKAKKDTQPAGRSTYYKFFIASAKSRPHFPVSHSLAQYFDELIQTIIMEKKKTSDRTEKLAPQENKNIGQAHNQAEKDIESDPDLNTKINREDDLDEGELARLEGEK